MDMQARPFVWQMIKQAVEANGNRTTNLVIKDWIVERFPDVCVNTILNQIIVCTVNHEARVHYRENQRPRRCNEVYDLLYRPAPGKVELYDPRLHGQWQIIQDEKGVLKIREIKETVESHKGEALIGSRYIDSNHLKAYISKNLDCIEEGLELYVDIFGNIGVDYPTDFGPIDILAVDKHEAFVVVVMRNDAMPENASGEVLKTKNWVKRHLAAGRPVRSYLVGPEIPENIRYALADCADVFLKEYDLSIQLKDVPCITDAGRVATETTIPFVKKPNRIEIIAA